jgi:carboxyl-terminal processing protease
VKDRFAGIAILIVIGSSLAAGISSGWHAPAPAFRERSEQFIDELQEAAGVVQRDYAGALKMNLLYYSAIRSMLRTLDPHSIFFDRNEFARLREEENSRYYGLGITVRRLRPDSGRSVILEPPAPGSPAAQAGIRAGDVLTHIDREAADNLTQDEIKDRLRGARGTWVAITIERPGMRKPLEYRLKRDEIAIAAVPVAFEVSPGVGYIKVEKFSESTTDELRQKLALLNADRLDGLILDFRNNPGGLLSQAIDVADLFLPRGTIVVSTKGRARGSEHLYRTVNLNRTLLPMVVLINGQSASASEIVAGALQDHGRALIVGETSFGKGLVQSVLRLGGETAMALTTARYYTPSGRQIQRDYAGAGIEYYYGAAATGSAGRGRKMPGGITPDITAPNREPNRFEARLNSKLLLFEYARRLVLGQVAAAGFAPPRQPGEEGRGRGTAVRAWPRLEFTNDIMRDFQDFLRRQNFDFSPADIEENLEFIKRGIEQEVLTIAAGRQEGARIAIQSDAQVQTALASLPAARSLIKAGRRMPLVSRPAEK